MLKRMVEARSTIDQVAHIFILTKLYSLYPQEDAELVHKRQPTSILEVANWCRFTYITGTRTSKNTRDLARNLLFSHTSEQYQEQPDWKIISGSPQPSLTEWMTMLIVWILLRQWLRRDRREQKNDLKKDRDAGTRPKVFAQDSMILIRTPYLRRKQRDVWELQSVVIRVISDVTIEIPVPSRQTKWQVNAHYIYHQRQLFRRKRRSKALPRLKIECRMSESSNNYRWLWKHDSGEGEIDTEAQNPFGHVHTRSHGLGWTCWGRNSAH